MLRGAQRPIDVKTKMKSILVTYPYFQTLPKGVKMMLVASENLFFGDATNVEPEHRKGSRPLTSTSEQGRKPFSDRSLLTRHLSWGN